MLRAHGVTDKGPVRAINEDCFAIDEERGLLVLADGMGGHRAGEVAAQLAVEAIRETVGTSETLSDWPFGFDDDVSSTGNVLRTAVHIANRRVVEAAGARGDYAGMGTTVVAAVLNGNRLSVAHVGDSRLYVFASGVLHLITNDDSWIASILAKNPAADGVALRSHPMRYALTNVVGRQTPPEVHITEQVMDQGAWVALTSDGVHGTLGDRRIAALFDKGGKPSELAGRLVSEALVHGSRDNCTAIVASVGSEER